MPHAPFLIPGYGAQGGGAKEVAAAFAPDGSGALVNSSRGIIFAGERQEFAGRFAPGEWERAVEAATQEMIADLAANTPAGNLQRTLQ
jgi:orotidine-5'-phosphate decarboxylase